jgi:DNA topoisomerase VI subunit B
MSERRFHTDSRAGENFTKDGLETLTGQSSRKWGRYAVKELVDNALGAAETTDEPAVSVSLSLAGPGGRRRYVESVSVTDNGPGFSESELEHIADVERFGGTKRHYALPSRGTQGNALMTLLGIQHLADGGPLTIETRGRTYEFHVDDATIDAVPSVGVETTSSATVTDGGGTTTVSVEFGDAGQKWAKMPSIMETLHGFATLNPHVRFDIAGRENTAAADTTTRYEPKGSAVGGRVLWYDRSAFVERVRADIRTEADLTVSEFVGTFDGLSSRSKCQTVLDDADIEPDTTLSAAMLTDGRTIDFPALTRLHESMRDATSARSADNLHNTLGSVGDALKRGPRTLLEHYAVDDIEKLVDDLQADGADVSDWRDLSTYYRASDAVETDEHRIPFVFELATIALSPEQKDTPVRMNFGINGSVSYSSPYASVEYNDRNKHRSAGSISSAFGDLTHSFIVVSNLTCPNIPFQDKGKQKFPTEPFEETISAVVGKTVRKYQRDIRPALNELEKSDEPERPTLPASEKAPQGFIKNTVFNLLEPVYADATENGAYSIMMRQLFYELRPRFHAVADRKGYDYKSSASIDDPKSLELNYDTFTDYVDEYERDVLGERIVRRDDRGFFVEPHSDERIELSTQKVNKYDPAEAVSTEYDTLLFVEKTGFYEQLHRDFKITKRYDIGLINAQGYSTTAIRNFVEKVKRADPSVEYLTLTDLDVGGLGIATDADAPDALSALSSFDATRLGVTVDDVDRFNLDVEDVEYNSADKTKLRTQYENGDINKRTYEFLAAGNRVEINAFAPTELKRYVETRLDELGVSKIEPDAAAVETPDVESWDEKQEKAIQRAIGAYVAEQVDADLIDALKDRDDAVAKPDEDERPAVVTDKDDVHRRLTDRLDEQPAASWKDVNGELVDEITEPVEKAQRQYENRAERAVRNVLAETELVSVDADALE